MKSDKNFEYLKTIDVRETLFKEKKNHDERNQKN